MKRIGLVLTMTPAYSETFFRNKIRILEQEGYHVTLFVGGIWRSKEKHSHTRVGFNDEHIGFYKFYDTLIACIRLIMHAKRSSRLYRLNKQDGFTTKQNLISLFKSAHIIGKNVDWLHYGFANTAIYTENLSKVIGAKMAVSIRGFDISLFPLKNPGCYELLWKRIDKLHYISDALYQKAIAEGLSPQVPAVKIEPAVDTGLLQQLPGTEQAGEMGQIRLLTIGRLSWKKGYIQTLTALAGLKTRGISFSYQIIGDGNEKEEILYMRKALGLEKEVVLAGKKTHKDTIAMLSACDIYIQYSVQEGFCNAVVEAQLLGKPCIVSNAEGLPENVLDGVTGWVVPFNDPKALEEKILEVLALPKEKKLEMGMRASERIQHEYSLDTQLKKFVMFYQD